MTNPTRRDVLALGVALAAGATEAADAPRHGLGIVIHSHAVRGAHRPTPDAPDIRDPIVYLEYCTGLGATGVQTHIGVRDGAYLEKLRARAEKLGMYLEGTVALPKDADDARRFARELDCAKAAGVTILRTVCMNGRRYETCGSLEAFKAFVKSSWESLKLAEPQAAKAGVRLAVENHKDWRADELLGILKRLDSKHVGVCLDTGNSIALLEEPHDVVKTYAEWTLTTHFKDMGVAEYGDGFLLAEVPLGRGFLDLKAIVSLIRMTRPDVRFNLEMITRDPLKVPCLTCKYWATFPELPGRYLADTIAMVRAKAAAKPLSVVSKLPVDEQLKAEAENIRASFAFAREHLGF
jgi:sugar phosphate isomerase/epimerase